VQCSSPTFNATFLCVVKHICLTWEDEFAFT
jgi:hypothetical protein